jgi:precorrin-6B methylase 2
MRLPGFFRRYWPVLLVLAVAAACWPAFDYLVDFRKPDVPFVTTPHDIVAEMLKLAEVTKEDTVYDLGSGDGRIVIAAARDHGARAVGIELDPDLVEQSRETIRDAGLAGRARVMRGDIFKQDLRPATVITMFLLPGVIESLRPQLQRLRPGTRIVSHMYKMPGARATRKVTVRSTETRIKHNLYLYMTPIEWE